MITILKKSQVLALSFLVAVSLFASFTPIAATHALAAEPDKAAPCSKGLPLFGLGGKDSGYQQGILGWVPAGGATTDSGEKAFTQYIRGLHNTVMPYIFFAAIIYVVFSGIQYMIGGYTPGLEKEAKTRIIGVIIGVLFYFIMITLYNWFVCTVGTL